MDKFLNMHVLVSILIVACLVAGFILILRSCGKEHAVYASISSNEVFAGEAVTYTDSTSGARSWLWEFGNGDYSVDREGTYIFPETGRYQIRLKVNDVLEKFFRIRVKAPGNEAGNDHLIRINAPDMAMQGEYILFSAEGNDRDWRWEFGESGIIDSREKTPIYAYQDHGVFLVRLQTEKTQYPVTHRIEILPKYMENDSTDAMSIAGNDIRVKLQNIADGKPFNPNYNHILDTYLCGNPNVPVTVNNSKRNDFYSYCQGLRLEGRNATIETVFIESGDTESSCIDHIIILQYNPGEKVDSESIPGNKSDQQ